MSSFPVEPVPVRVADAIRLCNAALHQFDLWIEGEVAQYSVSRGKFVWFDLKDETEEARLNCFMMLHQQSIPLEDGMRVLVKARPGIFSKSGKFTLSVQSVEAKGDGSLKRAFELLRAKLEKEGLFAPERKRALPPYPGTIGIISSADAAGYGDFRRIAESRFPGLEYVFCNVAVQGADAEAEITAAFAYLNETHPLDAIVLVRGGGSIEDLHAFNSEPVARAIVRSRVPVIVGVGHERDVTIADFCADVRASTPSNAAELLLPSQEELRRHLRYAVQSGQEAVAQAILQARHTVALALSTAQARTDQHIAHIRQTVRRSLIAGSGLASRMRNTGVQAQAAAERVDAYLRRHISQTRLYVGRLRSSIEALSPQQTLARGFSITTLADGRVVRDAAQVPPGTELVSRLGKGSIHSTSK